MFKPKTDSQIVLQKKVNTLDDTHDDFSKKFLEDKKLIPELEEKIKQLKDKKNTKGLDISQKLLYVDEIKSLQN